MFSHQVPETPSTLIQLPQERTLEKNTSTYIVQELEMVSHANLWQLFLDTRGVNIQCKSMTVFEFSTPFEKIYFSGQALIEIVRTKKKKMRHDRAFIDEVLC